MEHWIETGRALLGQETSYVLAGLGGTLVVSLLFRVLTGILKRGAERTTNIMDDAVLASLTRPGQVLIWFVGVTLVTTVSLQADWISKLQKSGILLILGWFLFSLIRNYSSCARQRGRVIDEDFHVAMAKASQATVIVLIGIGLLQTFGVSITGILTFGGVGGLVVGFAAKDMLENFFGGLMLHMDSPFKTGDWIRSPDRDIEGMVERIGWRQTLIRTHSRNALYVPNGMFLTIVLENPGRMSHRMIKEIIGLRYDDLGKMKLVLDDVQKLLEESEEIDPGMTRLARFDRFSESSVDFFIQCYTRTTGRARYSEIKQELLLEIARIVERHGAEIAFPTRTLYVKSDTGSADDGGT